MTFIEAHKDKISKLCTKHFVDKLYVFGSAASNSLSESSDIDLVVKFKKVDLNNYFKNYMSFKNQLKKLFHRDIDLLEEQAISNPYIKESIENSKELIYG